jgi:hypothetical protein
VDYPVYLPEYPEAQAGKTTSLHSTSSSDVKIHLFREAVALSRGEEAAPASDKNATRAGGPPNSNMWGTVSGTLENYDSVAQCDAPLANLSIGFQYGSLGSTTGSTDNNGYYEVMIPNPSLFGNNDTWTLTVTYRDPQNRWKIVPSGFVPYSITFSGYASSFINGGTAPTCLISSARQENEIQRAVSYLFNVQNSFPPLYNTSGGTIIEALSSSNNEYDGFFSSGSTHPRIQIYNNGRSCSVNIGTTLHELGHSIHYAYHYSRNNLSAYTGTIPFLKEAFANYVGWYLGEAYYRSLGWIKSDPRTDITGYQYQSWNVLNINVYSPLFIDLTDDLNQRGGALAPNDDIENVPPSVIWDVIKACQTWPQCRDIMENYVGTYYTSTEFDNYIYIYALWVSRNL